MNIQTYREAPPLPCTCHELVPNPCISCSPIFGNPNVPCKTPGAHQCPRHRSMSCNNCGRIVLHGNVSSDGVCKHSDADTFIPEFCEHLKLDYYSPVSEPQCKVCKLVRLDDGTWVEAPMTFPYLLTMHTHRRYVRFVYPISLLLIAALITIFWRH